MAEAIRSMREAQRGMQRLSLATTLTLALPASAQTCVVAAGCGAGDPYRAAAVRLAEHHGTEVLDFDAAELSPLFARLRELAPSDVVLVLRPEQLDYNLARAVLQRATELDDDPFVDFAFGYVTARTPEDALAFVDRSIAAARAPREPKLALVAGGVPRSARFSSRQLLRKATVPIVRAMVAGEEGHPEQGHDRAFVAKLWPRLADCNALTFAGHGYPSEVVGGPDVADLGTLQLDRAVVLNVACYTGVTKRWFDMDWRTRTLVEKQVEPEQSFALALLNRGVVGYTAYTCPRPAGPELDTDLMALVADGASLGEARRRDYDKTVLGFLGYQQPRLVLPAVTDGAKWPDSGDVVRDIMLEGATGGVLFGDPTLRPFLPIPGEAPLQVEARRDGDRVVVHASCPPHAVFTQCSDPTATFGDTMAMRVYARVPIGSARIRDVAVESLTFAGAKQETRMVWAFEADRGEHFAQVKILFARDERFGDVGADFVVELTDDARLARASSLAPAAARDG